MKNKPNREALIIFAKNPIKGKVKTRIASVIGKDKALEVYKRLFNITYSNTKSVNVDKYLFMTDYPDENLFDSNYYHLVQIGNDLGEKMKNAFDYLFKSGYSKVCIIGTDCPDLSCNIIKDAYNQLDRSDVIIGPSKDGGYYLIGMKRLHDFLFLDIEWGTSKVLGQTCKKIKSEGLSHSLLEELIDVDTTQDLNHLMNI